MGCPELTPKDVDRFLAKIQKRDECWEWQSARFVSGGYGAFNIKGKAYRAHRISWLLTHGQLPAAGLHLCHTCDNPPCCNPDHLFIGTPADNAADMVAKGRHGTLPGEKASAAKLRESDVSEIRRLAASGTPIGDMAAKFGLHRSQVSRIINGRKWKHSYEGPEIPKKSSPKKRDWTRKQGDPNPSAVCACGCGKSFDQYDQWGRPRRFISGHNAKKA